MQERGKVLAVDPGQKNIGIALSDPAASIARPLVVIRHVSRLIDAAEIARLANENQALLIIVGMPTGGQGEIIPQSRHSISLAEAIRSQSSLPVTLWDETGSTQSVKRSLVEMNVPVSKRAGHQDALAAAVILQSYLDARLPGED